MPSAPADTPLDAETPCEVSVVIPAHDEARQLPTTLRCLSEGLARIGATSEIVVVDDGSRDATAPLAAAAGARVVTTNHRQISRARNSGAREAHGEFLVFVDADTRVPPALLLETHQRLRAGDCGGGALVALEGAPAGFYRRGVRAWNGLSRRLGLAAGCFLFARQDAFNAVGGFDQRLYAGDEVFLSRALRKWGRRHGRGFRIITEPAVSTSARKAAWFAPRYHFLTAALVLLCPVALRSRRLMWFWYRRPEGGSRRGSTK